MGRFYILFFGIIGISFFNQQHSQDYTIIHQSEKVYEYDEDGRVEQVTYSDGTVEIYEYDANGNLLRITVKKSKSTEKPSTSEKTTAEQVTTEKYTTTHTEEVTTTQTQTNTGETTTTGEITTIAGITTTGETTATGEITTTAGITTTGETTNLTVTIQYTDASTETELPMTTGKSEHKRMGDDINLWIYIWICIISAIGIIILKKIRGDK